jgi:hypothetical protein
MKRKYIDNNEYTSNSASSHDCMTLLQALLANKSPIPGATEAAPDEAENS